MPFPGSQWCFPGLRTLISGEHFPCQYRCLLKHILVQAHIGPGCHSCACDTDEQIFAVKLSYFHMLFGHFSPAEKMKF